MMAQLESSSTTTTSVFAYLDITISAFIVHSYNDSQPWFIDQEASDHMTCFSHLFSSYSTCSGMDKVRVADGLLSSISWKCSIQCFLTMSLSLVLHVPNFSTNLLSVSSITKALNCSVTFFPTYFKCLVTRRTIGNGRAHGGLYLLESGPSLSTKQKTDQTNNTLATEQLLQSHQ